MLIQRLVRSHRACSHTSQFTSRPGEQQQEVTAYRKPAGHFIRESLRLSPSPNRECSSAPSASCTCSAHGDDNDIWIAEIPDAF